eukprot:TRINITY_DN9067_c0_g1_i1.p1 TRINITY_DN9067_c0_g1~~TRINITY_DN9067_c0_g1_i1.p1  ORF type:complete len:112 (+),score=12.47 TRINITY_DN9067_c0_g1_i1:369-704(+)
MANLGERFQMHEVEELMRVPELDPEGRIKYEGKLRWLLDGDGAVVIQPSWNVNERWHVARTTSYSIETAARFDQIRGQVQVALQSIIQAGFTSLCACCVPSSSSQGKTIYC